MYTMRCNITIGSYTGIKPSRCKIHRSVSDIVETAEIVLPLNPYLRRDNTDGTVIRDRNLLIAAGDKVSITMGYDDDTAERFAGYVARISKTVPMTVYCEGYSYAIKDKVINKSYRRTTIRQMLQDVVAGTDIGISPYTADVAVEAVTLRNTPAIKVLEWMQRELLCRVYFDGPALYVGATPYAIPKPKVTYRLGYNTAEDKDLQQSARADNVVISIVEREPSGSSVKTSNRNGRYDNVKEVKIRRGMPDDYKRRVAAALQAAANYGGYSGTITAFLVPLCGKGYTVEIQDDRYPERAGMYFAEEVDTSYGPDGGRQKIKLTYYGKELQ